MFLIDDNVKPDFENQSIFENESTNDEKLTLV